MFIGYPRSGHSLFGSLLDAHEHAVVAHEEDVLGHVERGLSDRAKLVRILTRNSARQARKGRSETGHSYVVPGQWQGRASTLRVLGDKKGGRSSRRLLEKPELLDRLRELIGGWDLRVIHVVRNPYDNISTLHRYGHTLPEAVAYYFRLCDSVVATKAALGDEVLEHRHEDLIATPKEVLRSCCAFLGLEAEDGYLEACAGIVYPSPNRSRDRIEWPRAVRDEIQARIADYPHLTGYAFEA